MKLPTYERMRAMQLLNRFFRTSLLLGRMPSVMGEESFRSRIGGTPGRAFEDAVIFVCDIERCLAGLDEFDRQLIALCIFEDRSEYLAARRFGRSPAEIARRLGQVLDLLYSTFCRLGLLDAAEETRIREILGCGPLDVPATALQTRTP
jgi:hypothetical protein